MANPRTPSITRLRGTQSPTLLCPPASPTHTLSAREVSTPHNPIMIGGPPAAPCHPITFEEEYYDRLCVDKKVSSPSPPHNVSAKKIYLLFKKLFFLDLPIRDGLFNSTRVFLNSLLLNVSIFHNVVYWRVFYRRLLPHRKRDIFVCLKAVSPFLSKLPNTSV